MLITTLQIVQMIVGTAITLLSGYWSVLSSSLGGCHTGMRRLYESGMAGCHIDGANVKMGLAMYVSYFILFSILFYEKVSSPDGHTRCRQHSPALSPISLMHGRRARIH